VHADWFFVEFGVTEYLNCDRFPVSFGLYSYCADKLTFSIMEYILTFLLWIFGGFSSPSVPAEQIHLQEAPPKTEARVIQNVGADSRRRRAYNGGSHTIIVLDDTHFRQTEH
jgi:hypothetical protein